jgi:hypothetical protein
MVQKSNDKRPNTESLQMTNEQVPLLFQFNPTFAGAGVAASSNATFASGFYTGGYEDCYAGGPSEMHYKCVTDIWKRLII